MYAKKPRAGLRRRSEAAHPRSAPTCCRTAITTPTICKAQKIRRLIAQDFAAAFRQCDVIMGPTSPGVAFTLGAKGDDPVQMYLVDIYTIAANLAGLPGMSIPCGFGDGGMPRRVCRSSAIISPKRRCSNVAHQYQLATDWHLRRSRRAYGAWRWHWEIVIGLETHAQLSTGSRKFFRRGDAVRRRRPIRRPARWISRCRACCR